MMGVMRWQDVRTPTMIFLVMMAIPVWGQTSAQTEIASPWRRLIVMMTTLVQTMDVIPYMGA